MSKTDKEKIVAFAKNIGIDCVGVCSADCDAELIERLLRRKEQNCECEFTTDDLYLRADPKRILKNAKSIIVCLFPYYAKNFAVKNISRYAIIKDYHAIVLDKLGKIETFMHESFKDCETKAFCDTGPLVDRFLAYRAGLGFFGKNNCLINDIYGSYFFIGYIITSYEILKDNPTNKVCLNCGKCIKACPGGALDDNFGFNPNKCVSYITQIKHITREQTEILKHQHSVYGCDVCQEVCPHNNLACDTYLPEFLENSLAELKFEELSAMSNREFKKKYKDFAFSWRNRDVILKNFIGGTYVKQRKDNG